MIGAAASAGLAGGLMDDDGLGTSDITIKLAITVDGERIHFDFAGSQNVKSK